MCKRVFLDVQACFVKDLRDSNDLKDSKTLRDPKNLIKILVSASSPASFAH